jgi:hypothetical protein
VLIGVLVIPAIQVLTLIDRGSAFIVSLANCPGLRRFPEPSAFLITRKEGEVSRK